MIELLLAASSGKVAGVDPTQTMVEIASARSAVQRAGDQVALSLGADDRVAFANASFDRIVALHSFQFWAQPERTAPRLRELLRDGGRLVLVLRNHSTGGGDWLPNPLSRRPDEPESAQALLTRAGFDARLVRRGAMLGVVAAAR